MAVPFLAIKGYHTLLGSQAGVVVDQPEPGTPGWSALVDPTAVVGVAEVLDGELTGFAMVVVDDTGGASAVILGSGDALVDGSVEAVEVETDEVEAGEAEAGEVEAGQLGPIEAVELAAKQLRLRLDSVQVVDDAAWIEAFGSSFLTLDNPDPVLQVDGTPLFEVGVVEVSGESASRFVGQPSEGSSLLSLGPRRLEFWSHVADNGLRGAGPLATLFPASRAEAGLQPAVFELPTAVAEADDQTNRIDLPAAEQLLRTLVPFPAGQDGTDRLRVRIVDGHGGADLESIARQVAARGLEVVEISTATPSSQPSQLIVPIELSSVVPRQGSQRNALDDLNELADELDVEQLVTTRSDDQRTVSLIVGPDLDLAEVLVN